MKDEDILFQAKEHYKQSTEAWDHIYLAASEDMKFVYDIEEGQWPDAVRRERAGRPIITCNKLQKFVRQIRGDQMQNRPQVKVIPVDDKADVRSAELYNGIIRQIEYLSSADVAYDTAYMGAISSSIGFFRIITKYADDEGFNQDIFIKRIINPASVHFDPLAVEFNLEDARYCFIEEWIDKKTYTKMYPDSDATSFDGTDKLYGDWIGGEKIRVAEYFYKEPTRKKIILLSNGDVAEVTGLPMKEIKEKAAMLGVTIMGDRFVDTHKVKWYKINGAEVLESSDWLGNDIPVIPVFGDEIVADGKKHYLSLIRGAKDMQRMYNYWATAATETIALTPKTPFLLDHKQVKGFENEWEDANKVNRPYIRYNHIQGITKPAREPQAQVPSAIMNMMQQTAYDIEDHLGRYEASKGEASNERSGKAILARLAQSDKGTYTFIDNLTRAIVAGGRQLIDLIPKVYDTARVLRIMGETGEEQLTNVNQPTLGPNGQPVIQNDLTVGKHDLIASVGASYSSKRQEMTQAMIESMQYAPMIAPIIAPLIFKYSDFPGAQEIYAAIQQGIANQQAQVAPQLQIQQRGTLNPPTGA